MAEASRSQVTITLGRTGQVVKRGGDSLHSDSRPTVGSKRSVRDRLGSNADSSSQLDSKRQRGDGSNLSLSAAMVADDMRLGQDDLRFKIMRKNVLNHTQSNGQQTGTDLRAMLSRPARPPTTSRGTQQRITEPKDARLRMPEPKEVRQHMPEPNEVKQWMPEPNSGSMLGQVPSMRSLEALPHARNSSSPWTLDRLRRRSPDGVLGTSRAPSLGTVRRISPPRNEELYRKPLNRTYDDARTVAYFSKEVPEFSRPVGAASFMTKQALPTGHTKPVAPLLAVHPPPGSILQKKSYTVNEQHTVDSLLQSLGLEKYAIYFKAEEVDMAALRQMGDNDLKELGVPMGPRKKIMQALLPRPKRQL